MPNSARALWKVVDFVLMFLSLVVSSSSSHSLGVRGATLHLSLLSASCVAPLVCIPSMPRTNLYLMYASIILVSSSSSSRCVGLHSSGVTPLHPSL
eukprot:6195761-Pleurochrysis_carterae.AAC.2